MRDVKEGDPITIVLAPGRLATGTVSGFNGLHTYFYVDAEPSKYNVCYPRDEGVRWIHGHHDIESREGRALLAAYALDPPVSVSRTTGPQGATGPSYNNWSPPTGPPTPKTK